MSTRITAILVIAWSAMGAWGISSSQSTAQAEWIPQGQDQGQGDLNAQGLAFLKTYCARCHSEAKNGNPQFDVLDRQGMIDGGYLTAGDLQGSYLWERIASGEMPPPDNERLAHPSDADKDMFKKWIESGANFPERAQREQISELAQLSAIEADLARLPIEERKFQRYISLLALNNNPNVTPVDLQRQRVALSKAINSLSWEPIIHAPTVVDQAGTLVRIDLRELGWSDRKVWDKLLRAYPYGLTLENCPDENLRRVYQNVVALSGSRIPCLRSDWLVSAATRPPLYHDILEIPDNDSKLEEQLRVDVVQNFMNDRLARAGFTESGVSKQNRLVERHPSSFGAYWKSYDFKTDENEGNLLRFPLGPVFAENPFPQSAFHHDGGEIIFTLPNGLQGYMLVDSKGDRIDIGPIQIVRDSLETSGTPEIVNGLSCMACHREGTITGFGDIIRDGSGLAGGAFVKLQSLYPTRDKMDALLQRDREKFLAALQQTAEPFAPFASQGEPDTTEPVGAVARRYDRDMDINDVCSELGLADPQQLMQAIASNRFFARLGLGPLAQGEKIKRKVWESREGGVSTFQEVARELRLGTPMVFSSGASQ